RHPVDHQARRETEDERDEDDRKDEHQDPLRLLHRDRHVVRRGQLARDVDGEQQRAPALDRRLRDVDEPEEVEARAVVLRLVPDLFLEVLEDVEERDEDRDLEDDRQARRRRVDLVLAVELHQLLVLPRAVVLPALLDLLHLRRVRLEVLHRVDLPHHHGHEHDPDEDDEGHDRPRPGEPGRAVEPLEERGEEVLERLQGIGQADDHARLPCSRSRKSERSATWSTPPWLHGLQRSSRQPATIPPRTSPSSRNASIAYCEQLGWYLHVPAGVSSPNVWRQACTAPIPSHLIPSPCRAPRGPARRATRGPGPSPAPRDPVARRARSRSPAARPPRPPPRRPAAVA